MKNLITLVVVVMTMGVNIVAAQKYEIDPETQEVSIVVSIVKPKTHTRPLELKFDVNVPQHVKISTSILTKLLRDGEAQLFYKPLKGEYNTFIMYYTPKKQLKTLSIKNSIVSYGPSFVQEGHKQFAWWYLFWILGLIAMLLFKKSGMYAAIIAATLGLVGTGMAVILFENSGSYVSLGSAIIAVCVTVSVAFSGAFSVAFSVAEGKKITSFPFPYPYLYYAFTIIAMVCAYYQI